MADYQPQPDKPSTRLSPPTQGNARGTLPRRRLADWHQDLGVDEDDWLLDLAAQGWTPEFGTGVDVTINGQRVRRYALRELSDLGPWPEPGISS